MFQFIYVKSINLKKCSTSKNGYHISNYWVYGIQIDTHIDETIDKDIIDMVIASAITAWARDALLKFVTKKTINHAVNANA